MAVATTLTDGSVWDSTMSVRLIYQQGSFRREERAASTAMAVDRALELMRKGDFYRGFAVCDGSGQHLLSGAEIVADRERRTLREDHRKELEAARILSARRALRKFR
jgi:hypothetical protein